MTTKLNDEHLADIEDSGIADEDEVRLLVAEVRASRSSSEGARGALRPEVLAFARVMSAKIDGHNHDRGEYGWRSATAGELLGWLARYFRNLHVVLTDSRTVPRPEGATPEAVLSKAANVANLAMMIADVYGDLAAASPSSPREHADATTCGLCGGHRVYRVTGADGRVRTWACDECTPSAAPTTPKDAAPVVREDWTCEAGTKACPGTQGSLAKDWICTACGRKAHPPKTWREKGLSEKPPTYEPADSAAPAKETRDA